MRGTYLLFLCGIACAGQESWEELMRRSDELGGQGKLAEAEITLLRALKTAESFAQPDLRLAETQHSLGTVYRDLGKLPEAEKWYERSLSTWKASVAKQDPKLPKPLISLAALYLENGLHSKAERLVDPWLRDPVFKLDATDPLSVNLLHNVAGVKYAQRKY